MEKAPFEKKTFAEYAEYARNWKTETIRNAAAPTLSKLSMMRVNGQPYLFALGPTPNANVQSILSCHINDEALNTMPSSQEKVSLVYQVAQNIDPLINRTAVSAEFAMLCERQRAQVTQGVTDYEICNDEMTLLGGGQAFRFNPTTNAILPITSGMFETPQMSANTSMEATNAVEPMEVTEGVFGPGAKGCSVRAEHAQNATPQKQKDNSFVQSSSNNFVSSAKLCPSDPSIVAYVLNKQVYVQRGDKVIFNTTSESEHVTNGVPSYIVQEELERFEGIWWSDSKKRLLYEHVNEDSVDNAHFGINGECPQSPMKYPRAGRQNAICQLRMVIIEDDAVYDVPLQNAVLRKLFPKYEYIIRAGFFSDGESVYVQLMNRDQSQCYLVLIPFWEFDLPHKLRGSTPPSNRTALQLSDNLNMGHWHDKSHEEEPEKSPRGKMASSFVVHKAHSDYWINTHHAIQPLKVKNEEHPLYEFIYCAERPHGSCLSLISAELDKNGYHRHTNERILMAQTFSINKSMGIVVDEKRELVYYIANESHAIEWNVCVTNYRNLEHRQLTEANISFRNERSNAKLAIDLDFGFCCYVTSLSLPPEARFYAFKWTEGNSVPEAVFTSKIMRSARNKDALEVSCLTPELIEYQSKKTGLNHFALVIRPENYDPTKKYPVFHYVYGGPGIQLVHNDFSWTSFIRFARLGYIVVIMDNRGTAHRGIQFEGHISRRMGTVEVDDQVEGLQILSERMGGKSMDMSRVVVHGWSYGGYMALQMIAKHPKVYCASIAGGAVTDWRMYDTAYTERYMGYPVIDDVYNASSVMELVKDFPVEPHRLMLVHGLLDENVHFSHLTELIDECVKKGKWHELVVFPSERHGVRNTDASVYLDARMMYFAQTAIHNV